MLEAMATGTPVVALNRGAVPELVRTGVSGLICQRPDELPAALRQTVNLDPEDCVTHVARTFSTERMAVGYEEVYRRFLAGASP
ncbi:glycosyltransferase family 4 protein, partial [Escherichia coli]|nr:glycosyltransferase family 4 protein [Escherichia coli]